MKRKLILLSVLFLLIACGCEKQTTLPTADSGAANHQSPAISDSPSAQDKQADSETHTTPAEGLQKLSDLSVTISEQIQSVQTTDYDNLTFVNELTVTVPNVLYGLKLTKSPNLPPEDCFAIFDSLFDKAYSDTYSDEDKKKLYRFISDDIPQKGSNYPYSYPAYYEHEKEILNGDISFTQLFIDTTEGYLAVCADGRVHAYNCGKTFKRDGLDRIVGMYFPSDYHEVIANYPDMNSGTTDCYTLLDGELSVHDAAMQAAQIVTDAHFGGGTDLRASVSQVKVIGLDKEVCGYSFSLTPSYEGVPFDAYEMENDGRFIHNNGFLGEKEYELLPGNAFMLESGQLDIMIGFDNAFDVEILQEYDSVISFEDAVQIMSDAFSEHLQLTVSHADLMYVMYTTDQETQTRGVDAVWKFTTENANDAMHYIIYVDAITGDCDYYSY